MPGFEEIVGHEQIVTHLKSAMKLGKVSHAYILSGEKGCGKKLLADVFAETLQCEKGGTEPCGSCHSCVQAQSGNHPDIIHLMHEKPNSISVDDVRTQIVNDVLIKPYSGKYKIYIIDEVHMMTSGAFNALLKTIEEPPAHVIFIFATTEPNKVLPTIISRCQRFDFNKVSMHDIKYRLSVVCKNEGIEIDENGLTLIAQLADGGMRDALSILDQCVAYCSSHIDVNDIRKIYGVVTSEDIGKLFYSVYKKDVDSFVKDIQKYSDMGMDIKRLTADFIHMLKDSLILDYSENSTLVSDMNKDMIRKYFKLAPINFRIKCMEELMDTYNKYTYASNALDYLEASLLKISSYSYESKTHIIDSDHNDFKEVEEEENYETSYDDTSDNSDIIEKNTQKDDNNGVLEKSEISDVSRETLKQSENTNNKIILNDEFVIQLLVGATKMERSIDTNKFNNIGQFISSLEFGKYAATLRNSSIMASGSNYIVVCVSSEIFAKQINEFELNYGYENFTEVLLGKAKKVFALDKTQQSRVKDEFKERMISGNLPEPCQVRLKRKDKESENNMSIEDHMKSLFPNIEIKED